jgi:hypothetical protein
VANDSAKSKFGRFAKALAPFAAVSLLVAAAEYALEARVVAKTGALMAAARAVVEAPPERVDPSLDGKLVHVAGELSVPTPLADEPFGVKVPAARLFRDVEVFSWVELEEENRGLVYVKRWVREPVSSLRFEHPVGHENARVFPYSARSVTAEDARLGPAAAVAPPPSAPTTPATPVASAPVATPPAPQAVPIAVSYTLDPRLTANLEGFEPLSYDETMLAAAPADVKAKGKAVHGALFLGVDAEKPAIGDVRVTFFRVKPGPTTVLAAQLLHGGTADPRQLSPWVDGGATPFFAIAPGAIPATELFAHEVADDAPLRSWGGRFGLLLVLLATAALAARRMGQFFADEGSSPTTFAFRRRMLVASLALVAVPLIAAGKNWSEARGWVGAILYGAAIVAGLAASGLALPSKRLRPSEA